MKKIANIIQPILIWFLLFGLTVNLSSTAFIFSFINETWGPIVFGSLFNIVLLFIFWRMDKKTMQPFFEVQDKKIYLLYVILILGLVFVPWHYHMELPVWQYILFVSVSVVWQNVITFGIFQDALKERVGKKWIYLLIPPIFLLGHIVFIINFLTKTAPLVIALTPVMALLFAYLREKTGHLHWQIFLHLMLYILTA